MSVIVTVDVWDTLVRRRCHPDHVKFESSKYILSLLSSVNISANELTLLRKKAEVSRGILSQKNGFDDEYNFYDVIHDLIERLIPNESVQFIDQVVKDVCQYEIFYECKVTYRDSNIEDLILSYSPDKCYFLSDFYMGSSEIKKILSSNGVDFCCEGFSSCDVGFNKRSGRLFQWFRDHELSEYEKVEHVHIGDNVHSDHDMPLKYGITPVHYMPKLENQKRLKKEFNYTNKSDLLLDLEQRVRNKSIELDRYQALGCEHSFLYFGFVSFILNDARRNGLEHLYFFTREGVFFKRIYDLINEKLPKELRGPEASLLDVSRVATFFPSLREPSIKELMRVWSLYSTQSLSALALTLGLPLDIFQKYSAKHSIPLDEMVVYPWKDKRIIALFEDKGFLNALSEAQKPFKYALDEYLKEKKLREYSSIGVVDIGWRGTIQDNLSVMNGGVSFTGYYLGLQSFLNHQPCNSKKVAYGPDLNRSFSDGDLLSVVSPLEVLCNHDSGSVVGYEEHDGKIIPRKKNNIQEDQAYNYFTKHYQDGCIEGVAILSQAFNEGAYELPYLLRGKALKTWKDIVNNPNGDFAAVFFSLSHNEEFGLGEFVDHSRLLNKKDVFLAFFNKAKRHKVIYFLRGMQWYSGLRYRSDVSSWDRWFVIGLLRLAILYKRIRLRMLRITGRIYKLFNLSR